MDFGFGFGASTLCMGEMLPDTEVVGAELGALNVEMARRVLAVRGLSNVRFWSIYSKLVATSYMA